MEWYHYLLIVLGSLLILTGIVFLIVYLTSKKAKTSSLKNALSLCNKIVDTFGGIDNIESVNVNGSRLSITLKDNSYINNNTLKTMTDEGFGVVKTSKKITLVVGEMAKCYYDEITSLLNSK